MTYDDVLQPEARAADAIDQIKEKKNPQLWATGTHFSAYWIPHASYFVGD